MPFLDLRPRDGSAAVREAIARVTARGWYVLGPEVDAFETEFAAASGAAYAVGTGTGLTVARLAPPGRIDYLMQSGLVPVDMQVLLPPMSDRRALWARYGL